MSTPETLDLPYNVFTDRQMITLIGEAAVDEISGEGSFHQFDKDPDYHERVRQLTQDIFHGNPAYSTHKLNNTPLNRLIHAFDLKGVVVHRVPGSDTYLIEGLLIAHCRYLKRLIS